MDAATAHPVSRRLALRSAALLLAVPLVGAGVTYPAHAADFPDSDLQAVSALDSRVVAEGVQLAGYQVLTASGSSRANLLTVDLDVAQTELLTAPKVAMNQRLDTMAYAAGALAAVNADFFQNTTDLAHAGVRATGAAVGVQIRDGRIIKSSVPEAQRHGETMPNPINVGTEVIGVLRNGTGVVSRVQLSAFFASEATGKVPLNGLNIYGMGTGQIIAFDENWGTASRQRAACGNEIRRTVPCTTDLLEVVITQGRVASVSSTLGAGQIDPKSIVLVGREKGAEVLSTLQVGDEVGYNHRGVADAGKLDWAVGGGIVVQDSELANIIARPLNPRTYAGVSADGATLYLLVVDGRDGASAGVSTRDGADLIRHLGADDAVLLDGGGSSTMLVRDSTESPFELVSRSSIGGIDGLRAIANGIGVVAP